MARLFTNGFENNTITAKRDQWNQSSGTPILSSTYKRTGSYAGGVAALVQYVGKYFGYKFVGANGSGPYYFRTYMYVHAMPNNDTSVIGLLESGGTQPVNIVLRTTGVLAVMYNDFASQAGSNSSALSVDTWYRIEVKFDRSGASGTHIVELKIDGVTAVSVSNLTITNGFNQITVGANLQGDGATSIGIYFDDVAFNDSTGSYQNSYPGDGKVAYIRPGGSGYYGEYQWNNTSNAAGSSSNYSLVNEVTPDTTTSLVQSNTATALDLYTLATNSIGASDTVNLVEVHGIFRNNTADATTGFKFECRAGAPGATVAASSEIKPNTTAWSQNELAGSTTNKSPLIMYQTPDGAAWTSSNLASTEIGVLLNTAGTNRVQVSTVWAVVEYVPSAGIVSPTYRRQIIVT